MLNNKITALCQDRAGFIWIGTQVGLQRYDGTRFKTYLADIRDTAALQTDWISAVFEDSKKRLWIGTDHGAPYVLDRTTGKFYNYNLHAKTENKINGTWHFAEDKKGNIWLAGHEGYFKLNEKTSLFEKWNAELGLKESVKTGNLTIDQDDNLWLCTTEGVCFYNTTEKKLYSKSYNPAHNSFLEIVAGISNIVVNANDVWISTAFKTVYRYNLSTKKIYSYEFDKLSEKELRNGNEKEYIGFVIQLRDGQIMLSLPRRGLAYYNPENDDFSIVNIDNTKEPSFHASGRDGSNCIIQDEDNNLLIGSDEGINVTNQTKQSFRTHILGKGGDDFSPKGQVSDFLELSDGNILIGYYEQSGGIVKTDSTFKVKQNYLFKQRTYDNSGRNQIWTLFRDEEDIIWAPNQNNSVLKLNLLNDKLWEDTSQTQDDGVNVLKQGSDGDVWIAYWSKGLGRINNSKHTQRYYNSFMYPELSVRRRVHSILVDDHKIWVGTFQNGLQVFDIRKEKFTEAFIVNERDKKSISSNTILDIIRYNQETLILATEMGVNIFDTKKNIFTAITSKDGLPNNLVLGLMRDEHADVWAVCSGGGLCKINMQNFDVTTYNINDGIIDNTYSGRIYNLRNGSALIAASNGFISFTPSTLVASQPPSNVLITGFSVFEKEKIIDSLSNKGPIVLTYKENSIRIEFASLDLWEARRIKYFYKLEGIDKDWILAGKNQAAIYNQLNNGKYIFKVKCANRDGVFSNSITEMKIIITPPFWKTWWFILIMGICGVLFVFAFIKWREKNIRAFDKEKLKVEQLSAAQYKSKLEMEQIVNYFSSSLVDKHSVDDVLWDVAENLISRLGFVDCMMYLWNTDKTKMIQRASYGPKDSVEQFEKQYFDVALGQGVVGHVMQTRQPILIADTSKDARYRIDDLERLSELTVPIIYNDELIGVIDSEHHERNFFTTQHLQILTTIATLTANKIISLEAEKTLQRNQIEMYSMNEQLSNARLEALRSQMNPHFIFNSLNAIQECILTNKVDAAYEYLSKFSKLQRMVLNNSSKEFIPFNSELEMLQLYLSLESLRFSQSFTYKIEVDNNVDTDDLTIPPMLIQPYVENAIWHGLRNKTGDKLISIICKEEEGMLIITIDDNGIGRKEAAIIKAKKLGAAQMESKGTGLTEQRADLLSVKYKANIYINTVDKVNEQHEALGTTVTIMLPIDIQNKQ
ncbi:MAG: histidine kinase [Chitinophagaceae bacterium]